mgnify:CR=1 FL=1
MMIDKIRALTDAKPFRPFVIYFTDGEKWEVPSSRHIGPSPSGLTWALWKDNAFHFFEVSRVKDVEAKNVKQRRKRRSA